jgi:hypothetical protein
MFLKRISYSVSVMIRLCTFLQEVHSLDGGAFQCKCKGFLEIMHVVCLFCVLLVQVMYKLCRLALKCPIHC